jgi:hypothetical protein
MRIPKIIGLIDRRILANFRVDPDVMSAALPPPFRPKCVNGFAIGGVCLIRLKRIRPRFTPIPWGLCSENAAHRVAVEWDESGVTKEGVFIPRRDTDSRLSVWAGGSIFPGVHHHATFDVTERDDYFSVAFQSDDGAARVHVVGTVTDQLPRDSTFQTLSDASDFFLAGSLGYSATDTPGKYDGLELNCENWRVEPMNIERVESSFFDDESRFTRGSVEFDCALLMRNIPHEWRSREDLCCSALSAHDNDDRTTRIVG